jgi:hypothetical protein
VRGLRRELGEAADRRRREAAAREPQVDREHGEPDRAERDEPELDAPVRQALAQERPDADADREQREQERHDRLVAADVVAREAGELREVHRAVEPEPRDPHHREPHDAVAAREP